MVMKVLVVGNGAIGMLSAVTLARAHPTWSVTLIGPSARPLSASTAAGAMVNVYAEIEHGPPGQMRLGEKLLQLGIRASESWNSILRETNGGHVITARDTLVVLKKDAYDFEERNFSTMTGRVVADSVGQLESPAALRYLAGSRSDLLESLLRIRGEFAMDSHSLMRHLDGLASSVGVKTVNSSVETVLTETNEVRLVDGSRLKGELIVVAAGAFSQSLFSSEDNVLQMFQGVGTALVVPKMPEGKTAPGEVIRTVNRGGAQCGVHLVPLVGGGLYIGAGNRVSEVGEPALRFETVAYLLQTVEREFLGRSTGYLLEGNVRMGLRPRSLDGAPMIGPLAVNDKIFIATATNRAGLTWAPEIAAGVASWARRGKMDSIFDDWRPDRRPIVSDSDELLLEHFVESRLGAGLEHGTVQNVPGDIARAESEIRAAGKALLNPKGSAPPPTGTHPDNWAAVPRDFLGGRDVRRRDSKTVGHYSSLSGLYPSLSLSRRNYNAAVDSRLVSLTGQLGPRWLDIGAGDGVRALSLNHELKKNLTVLEPSALLPKTFESDHPNIRVVRSQLEFADFDHEFDLVTMLWNVVGHLESLKSSLRQVAKWTAPSGLLFFDVNSPLNIRRFGLAPVLKNMTRSGQTLSFPWPQTDSDSNVKFYRKGHLVAELAEAGFLASCSYLDYDSGFPTRSGFTGSMIVVARKLPHSSVCGS